MLKKMGDSSDSEEFFDAEEFTPVKGSKRSSICSKSASIGESNGKEKENNHKEKAASKPDDAAHNNPATSTPTTTDNAVTAAQDDRNTVKNVVQGRRRFQELRRCMQTEEEDEPDNGASVSAPTEHPFKIISHDTMSLQSMTSLGRIGRILSGAAESHSNIRESTTAPSASSREPSTVSDDPISVDRTQNALAMAEPDVIASTKANSLKHARAASAAVVAVSGAAPPAEPRPASVAGPVAPPRKKKRNRLHGSQSLSTADGDNLSICTTDTDEIRYVRRLEKPQLESLLVEPPLSNSLNQTMALPSPASTIESLTREFQDSLELSQSKYAALEMSSLSQHESRSSERASASSRGSASLRAHPAHPAHSTLDIKEAVKGEYVVRPQDEERSRAAGGGGATAGDGACGATARTHSEGRPPATGTSSLGSVNRYVVRPQDEERSRAAGGGGATAGDGACGATARTHSEGRPPATGTSSLGSVNRYVVRPQDEERSRAAGGGGATAGDGACGATARTHSEGRPPATGTSSLGSVNRYVVRPQDEERSRAAGGGGATAGDGACGATARTHSEGRPPATGTSSLGSVNRYVVRPQDEERSRAAGGGGATAGDGACGATARTHSEGRPPATGTSSLGSVNRYVVRPQDEERSRAAGGGGATAGDGACGATARTHSEGRPPATGTSSLGSVNRRSDGSRARRRSAGDSPQAGAALHARAGSPDHQLSDIEILEQVTVLNLDTGERVPLSVAEHKLPQCINPLSLHIMRLTSEYIGRANDDENTRETDEESESVCAGGAEDEAKEIKKEGADRQTTAIKRKTEKLKRFFGSTVKKTVDAAKSLAQEVSHARHKEDVADIADDVRGEHNIKLKASNSHKGPYDFDGCVRYVQEMGSGHSGAVWCCKFSVCGRLLATAGQDKLLRIWVTRDAYQMFHDMRTKYNAEKKSSPTPSQESLAPLAPPPPSPEEPPLGPAAPFCPKPFVVYAGHTSDLLDVSWSKNYFILSSSMDKTVRLWHISIGECLCCFQHIDFVTAIVFHPRDDRYFLSGSLDGKLRLWDIPDKKVAVWNEVDGKTKLITAANFCQNGKFAVVGTYDGRCIFYTTDQLKYHTQIDVRSTRGKNSTGRKISGIEPMPNDDKILITSNDSRIRLYDLRDLNLSCKYKGYVNVSSQIKASFSHDGKYIVSGSENQCIYIWKTCHDYSKFTSVRRDRNDFWEGIKAHNAVVTCAVFAPNPDHMIRMIAEREEKMKAAGFTPDEKDEVKAAEGGMVASSQTGHVLVSADFNGCIKVFVHKAKPKHSSLPASALA